MNKQELTRTVPPDEVRADAMAKRANDPKDNLTWIETERDLEAAKRAEAWMVEDKVAGNHHDERAQRYANVALELAKLREQNRAMGEALKNRITVAVIEAAQPPWRPTHKHYKGTLYRVTGARYDAGPEELVEMVEYDDMAGNRYVLNRDRFESQTETGKWRYKPLLPTEQ